MKKILANLICIALIFSLVGCSNTSSSSSVASSKVVSQQASSDSSAQESSVQSKAASNKYDSLLDKVTMKVINAKKEAVVGDRTADNVSKENGGYFADGSNIVKAADYERIIVSLQVENKSNKAIAFSEMGWSAVMPDGFKLDKITIDGDIKGQVPSNYSGLSKVSILIKKSLNVSSFKLTYNLMDYNDQWSAALSDVMQNNLTEKQYNAKYGDKFSPKTLDFDITIK